jgi:hypothetical protein
LVRVAEQLSLDARDNRDVPGSRIISVAPTLGPLAIFLHAAAAAKASIETKVNSEWH